MCEAGYSEFIIDKKLAWNKYLNGIYIKAFNSYANYNNATEDYIGKDKVNKSN